MLQRILWRDFKTVLRLAAILLLLGWAASSFTPGASAAGDPAQGTDGPILIVTTAGSNFGIYHAEILRNEGFTNFAVADVGAVTPATLARYDVVILTKMALTAGQVSALTSWVNGGGNLIAMAPDPQLSTLLGLSPAGTPLSNAYLGIDTSRAPGNGLVAATMQYHGDAARYTLNGATAVATLYSNSHHADRASGGHAAQRRRRATPRRSRSTSRPRSSRPARAIRPGPPRSATASRRSAPTTCSMAPRPAIRRPDWVDLNKVAIPQADEQQRLLANLITDMNADRKPLPRFWYFPNGKKAVVVMTGDDHGNWRHRGALQPVPAASPAGCSVANWECMRGTSYLYTDDAAQRTRRPRAVSVADGFEVGLHVNTGCARTTRRPRCTQNYDQQMLRLRRPSIRAAGTERRSAITASCGATGASAPRCSSTNGMRLDTSYYYWPAELGRRTRPASSTGSAMPMRFAELDGSLDRRLSGGHADDRRVGADLIRSRSTPCSTAPSARTGYYGVYTVNAHTDVGDSIGQSTTRHRVGACARRAGRFARSRC